MRKILALACLALGLLAVARPAAASAGGGGCVFPWTQTYRGWGPSAHYEQVVTVRYEAECTATETDGTIHLAASGTATVYTGEAAEGEPIDTTAFTNTATWSDPEHPGELNFWACSVASADYDWSMAGVYDFSLSATDGHWSLDVSPDGVHFEHPAC